MSQSMGHLQQAPAMSQVSTKDVTVTSPKNVQFEAAKQIALNETSGGQAEFKFFKKVLDEPEERKAVEILPPEPLKGSSRLFAHCSRG